MHQQKLYIKTIVSGALFIIPNYTRIPVIDMRREGGRSLTFLFTLSMYTLLLRFHYFLYFIILSRVLQTTAYYPSLV